MILLLVNLNLWLAKGNHARLVFCLSAIQTKEDMKFFAYYGVASLMACFKIVVNHLTPMSD